MKKPLLILSLFLAVILLAGCTFIVPGSISSYDPPGFLLAIWHGMLAPYTLIIRWFTPVEMYSNPSNNWLYDLGFLLGVSVSLPIGWIAAIISVCFLIFGHANFF